MSFQNITKCRVCGNQNLYEVIHIEEQFISPTFVKQNENNPLSKIRIPLTVLLCDSSVESRGCGLVQLKETTDPKLLYTEYFYRSATNSTMVDDLATVVSKAVSKVKIKDGDIVVDIAANDGTLLRNYSHGLTRIGVEPAKNIDWSTLDSEIIMINDYFNEESLCKALNGKKVKIFTCCAMFYDLDDPNDFVEAVKKTLAKDGVWCIQLSYVLSMLKNMNFYDICHEHLEYYSLETLNFLMEKHGLTIFDAELNGVNGGSALVFITHLENQLEATSKLQDLLQQEKSAHLSSRETYLEFGSRINELKTKVFNTIMTEVKNGGLVVGLGASTKGNVLLQFFGLTKDYIPFISEINVTKIGLRTLGSDIPLVSDATINEMKPSMKLVLPWYFKDEIVARESEYLMAGGKLFFPMPHPHIVTNSGEVVV
jgi:hypothetical protein